MAAVKKARKTVVDVDVECVQISKSIAWILRHGAKGVGINIDNQGWVEIAALRKYGALSNVGIPKIADAMNRPNTKKARYQISADGFNVRAYDEEERSNLNAAFYEGGSAAQMQYPGQHNARSS